MRTAVPSITAARIPIIVNVAELMVMFKNNILVKHLGLLNWSQTISSPQWRNMGFYYCWARTPQIGRDW